MDTAECSPRVSVVIATYNMAPFLGAAVESVLAQTFKNFDVHVVDDGSTDHTPSVLEAFAHDPRLHYYRQENRGQTKAKNEGIRRSRGEFVAFCDADDLWMPDKLALQLPLFEERPRTAVVYSRVKGMNADGVVLEGGPQRRCYRGQVTSELFVENFVPFGTAVVRRRCLEELGGFDEGLQMGIDWELWLRLSTRYEFDYIEAPTYIYRNWSGQMSNNWRGRYENAFRIMREFEAAHPSAVSRRTRSTAWAHSYSQRARIRSDRAGEHFNAALDGVRALRYRPLYGPAWRVIARSLILAAGLRR